jgi:hypothetical protein
MKKNLTSLLLLSSFLTLASCSVKAETSSSNTEVVSADSSVTASDDYSGNIVSSSSITSSPTSVSYSPSEGVSSIALKDGSSTSSSSSVTIDNATNVITITAVGDYLVTGSLSNGNILISAKETDSNDTVKLILNGVSISKDGTNSINGPIYAESSAKLNIERVEGSSSFITDSRGTESDTDDNDDTAAIFSNKKLTLSGLGSLTVASSFNNGLGSDTKIRIKEGVLVASAPNHVIKAHKSIILGQKDSSPSFYLTSTGSDGACVRVDEVDTVTTPVYGNSEIDDDIAGIEIKDGYYNLSSAGKGVSSEAYLYVEGGNGSVTSSADSGFKAELDVHIDGGKFTISTPKDDCIHSSTTSLYCAGGSYTLTSGSSDSCQGLKGEEDVFISGGYFLIKQSNEGIAAHRITASGGTTVVYSSDDGWSAGGTNEQSSSICSINISGGYHYLYASGDGLDSNGNIDISGGVTIVSAPNNGGNGPIDYGDGGSYYFKQEGGIIIAYGTSGMAVGATSGNQGSVLLSSHSSVASGNYILFKAGEDYYAIKTTRNATTTYFSFPSLVSGVSYEASYASSISNETSLFSEANFFKLSSYTAGTTLTSGTLSSSSLHVSSGSSGGGGNPGKGGGGAGPRG